MRNLICLLFIMLSLSCDKPISRNSEITKVELARSGAWSDFGAAIIIDSALNYKYCDDNIKEGNFSGKIGKRFWDTLTRKLEAGNFKTVDSTTNMTAMDAEYYELIIHWKNKKRRILRTGHGQDPILKTCKWLNNSYKNVKLHQLNTPIKFESEFQKIRRPPFHVINGNQ